MKKALITLLALAILALLGFVAWVVFSPRALDNISNEEIAGTEEGFALYGHTVQSAEDITEGTGREEVDVGMFITAHYRMLLFDGTEIDTTYGREPIEFVYGVIGETSGSWLEETAGMRAGGKKKITVLTNENFGLENIAQGTVITYEVEILSVKNAGFE
ncbi:FKBP-type peptidyl-prolyl cis-trans isomerase [bacterium]|nr:FKBP-type peptidyl-prolyl cis-trans isomerase [bacterium]